MAQVLIATVKPFSPAAIAEVKKVTEEAGYTLDLLEKYKDHSDLKSAVRNADALIVRSDRVDQEVIESAENLKIIVRAGAGYDNIDLEAASKAGVVVMNTPGQNSNAVAELGIGMMIYLNRNGFNGTAGTELRGKKIGIHAYGYVGRIVGMIAKGLGMKVYAYDPYVDKVYIENDGVKCEESLESLYRKCQYISLHIPANEKTKESINLELMALMPEGATLINTARKEVIHEPSLLSVFKQRSDFRYISDIAPDCKEEIMNNYPGRAFFTPKKMGAQTAEANRNAGIAAAKQIVAFLEKGDTTFKVN